MVAPHTHASSTFADGPLSFKKIHDIVPKWMIDIKTKNLGRSDGVACSMVDVFYVPGKLAEPFGWLALLTAKTGTEVCSGGLIRFVMQ